MVSLNEALQAQLKDVEAQSHPVPDHQTTQPTQTTAMDVEGEQLYTALLHAVIFISQLGCGKVTCATGAVLCLVAGDHEIVTVHI